MKKLLIVDDSAFMRGILKDLLKSGMESGELNEKFDISEADGKKSAMEQINKNKPDLVLLDIVMKSSEVEGLNLLQEIREKLPEIKVIMISSIGQDYVVNQCKALGVSNYISKPFEQDKVIESINKAFGAS